MRRAERVEVEEEGVPRGSDGEVPPPEGLHAFQDRLLRAGRDEHHAHVEAAARQRPRDLEQRDHAGRVVVGARHDAREPMSASTAGVPAETIAAGAAQRVGCRAPSRARPAPGPPNTGNITGGLVSLRSISAGKRRQTNAGMAGMEDQPGVGGVVMRDQHDRASRASGGPISATTLKVSRRGSRRRAGWRAAGEVVPDRRRGERRRAPRRQRGWRRPRRARQRPGAAQQRSGRQYSPCTRSASMRAGRRAREAPDDPLRRLALALRRGRALDRRQLVDVCAQAVRRRRRRPCADGGGGQAA